MIVLIDGDHLLARCYYATSDSAAKYGGVRAFISSLRRIINDYVPQYVVVCWGDRREKLWRRKQYPAYKAHRTSAPEELVNQLVLLKQLLTSMGVSQTLCEGFEADDVIASLALETQKFHVPVGIVSGDHDLFQLIIDEPSPVFCLIPSSSGYRKIKTADVVAKYGIEPSQLPHMMAMVGEKGDGIAGIPGIGKKRAVAYIKGEATAAVKATIEAHKELIEQNLTLVDLRSIDMEEFPSSTLQVGHQPFRQKEVMKLLLSIGLFGKSSSLYYDILSMMQVYYSIREKKAVSIEELTGEL